MSNYLQEAEEDETRFQLETQFLGNTEKNQMQGLRVHLYMVINSLFKI